MNVKSRISTAAVALALMMAVSGAHAFGNACKRVNFSVDNNFGDEIIVEKFELYSVGQGRYLNEDFPDVTVRAGAQDFAVRRGETVEYGEGDRIRDIKVTFRHFVDNDEDGPGEWHYNHTWTDSDISDPICVADRWYKATINR